MPDGVTHALTELNEALAVDGELDAGLHQIAALCASLIATCDGCGVSVADDGGITTRAASDERADRVDAIQYEHDDGPCLQAIDTGEPVIVDSFQDERRWQEFIEQARGEGIVASYSVPLTAQGNTVGSLNLYSSHGPFDRDDREVADLLAAQAGIGLRNALTFAAAQAVVEQLREALGSRDVIGQAKGILMARHGVDADAAFDLLRVTSQHKNVKLRDVAADVVERQLRDSPSM